MPRPSSTAYCFSPSPRTGSSSRPILSRACEHRDPYNPRPTWQNFLTVFRGIDQGDKHLHIPPYNGGLFRELPELADLEISDRICNEFKELGEYDFAEDVSVDVLGHIFEQSITDLEQLRREAATGASASTPTLPSTGTQKTPSKRKAEGIFYTPAFVTSFLVRGTLGQVISDTWERVGAGRATKKKERIEAWELYQSQLRRIRVLDPACGSGAFLLAAFDLLAQEFDRTNRTLAELRGQKAQTTLFDLTKTLLNENLFGVDKSSESVEITKLSLWLKTAERGKKLTFLDRNVRHGNSVVNDPMVDPWAFDWSVGQVARSFLEPALPIPVPTDEQREIVGCAVEASIELTRASHEAIVGVLDVLRVEYDVETAGQTLADFATLDSDDFVREVKKRRAKSGKPLSPAALKALRELFQTEVPGILTKRAQILKYERNIASQVHAAYKLTVEDLDLLRASQPPRMPPVW